MHSTWMSISTMELTIPTPLIILPVIFSITIITTIITITITVNIINITVGLAEILSLQLLNKDNDNNK